MIFPPYNCLNWSAPLGIKADLDVLQKRWDCVVACGKQKEFQLFYKKARISLFHQDISSGDQNRSAVR